MADVMLGTLPTFSPALYVERSLTETEMIRFIDLVRQWYANRAAIAELERMDDHLLADLGISRLSIARVIREGVSR